jgi:hypothetical protein
MSLNEPFPILKLDYFHYPIQEKNQEMELWCIKKTQNS